MSRAAISALLTLAVCGCSGRMNDKWRQMLPPTYPAHGTVTYKGKPLEGATVAFHPRDGVTASRRAAAGLTDSTGRFTLTTVKPRDGAVAGAFLVTVTKTAAVVPPPVAAPPEGSGSIPLVPDPLLVKPLIPERYFSPETSGFSAEIKPTGRNEFSFSLQ